ncbi:MAG: dicarboxylate/amino acid:cation symporter [Bacteroidetes bacterium]|nr:MAG: dicarboxylate/amino acid:cation symporter [Bacteroidota bacterium]
MNLRRLSQILLISAPILIGLHLLLIPDVQSFFGFSLPLAPFTFLRWAYIVTFAGYAFLRKNLTTWIFFSLILGAEVGHDFPTFAVELNVFSKLFIKLIKTIIAPLLMSTIIVGIAGHSDIKQVGRLGIKALGYFIAVTTIALFIGLAAINISQAGKGIEFKEAGTEQTQTEVRKPLTGKDFLLDIAPENIVKSIYEGKVLPIVVFSILFGLSMVLLSEEKRSPMLHWMESLSETMFKFTSLIMYFAPIGVGCAIAYTVGHMGIEILVNLGKLVLTLYVALIALGLLVFLPIALVMKIDIPKFIRYVTEPASIAFATTSSDSALPKAMEQMEKFGVPRKIVSFVIPLGYSFNLDGTTLYLSLATIFVAQAAGIDLSLGQQLGILATLLISSKGVAAVPRASLVILFATAEQFGLPLWPIYLILGVDELMDMARTATNVVGNCLATVVMAKWEGEFEENPSPEAIES